MGRKCGADETSPPTRRAFAANLVGRRASSAERADRFFVIISAMCLCEQCCARVRGERLIYSGVMTALKRELLNAASQTRTCSDEVIRG